MTLLLPTLAVAFAAVCVWLAVRIVVTEPGKSPGFTVTCADL